VTSKSILPFATFVANKYVHSPYFQTYLVKQLGVLKNTLIPKTNIHCHFDVCLIFNKKVYMCQVADRLYNAEFAYWKRATFLPKIKTAKIEFDRNLAFPSFLLSLPSFISSTSLPVWTEAR
jgi:hypothetical protein